MTQSINPNREPTLLDVVNKIDGLSKEIDDLSKEVELSTERFGNYQQAVQWVVQLAFTLIASATITVIISAVLK